MRRAKKIYDDVRATQELLGTGEVAQARTHAERLRVEALDLLTRQGSMTSFDRAHALAALTYSTVTLVLAYADMDAPAQSIPAIRALAAETCSRRRSQDGSWKVLAAAAEMLARSGDASGAAWAAKKARALGDDADYLSRLAGGISSMYPQVFAQTPDDPPDRPPPATG